MQRAGAPKTKLPDGGCLHLVYSRRHDEEVAVRYCSFALGLLLLSFHRAFKGFATLKSILKLNFEERTTTSACAQSKDPLAKGIG